MTRNEAHAVEKFAREGAERPSRGRAPVDLVHLARQTFGSVDLEHEVLRLFVRQSADLVRRLAAADTPRDRAELAHRLKGSARAIGAGEVAELCEALETAARPADVGHLVDRLAEAVTDVEVWVARLLLPAA